MPASRLPVPDHTGRVPAVRLLDGLVEDAFVTWPIGWWREQRPEHSLGCRARAPAGEPGQGRTGVALYAIEHSPVTGAEDGAGNPEDNGEQRARP